MQQITSISICRFSLLCIVVAAMSFAMLSAQTTEIPTAQAETILAKYGSEIADIPGRLPAGWKIISIEEGRGDTTSTDKQKILNNLLVIIRLSCDTSTSKLGLTFYPASACREINSRVFNTSGISVNFRLYPEGVGSGTKYCVHFWGHLYISIPNNQLYDPSRSRPLFNIPKESSKLDPEQQEYKPPIVLDAPPTEYAPVVYMLFTLFPHGFSYRTFP